jgi:hypothetical protein
MKSQSRTGATGFGPLAVAELKVLQDASTVLSQRNINDATALKELTKIYNIARKYNQPPLDNKELGSGVAPITTPKAKAVFDDASRNNEAAAVIARAKAAAGKGGQ